MKLFYRGDELTPSKPVSSAELVSEKSRYMNKTDFHPTFESRNQTQQFLQNTWSTHPKFHTDPRIQYLTDGRAESKQFRKAQTFGML